MSDVGFGTIFVSLKTEEKQELWESLCDYAMGIEVLLFFIFFLLFFFFNSTH